MSFAAISRRVVYPMHERLFKRPTFSYLESLERSQWLTRTEIEQLQEEKLRALLQVAARHCPWHAERLAAAGVHPPECTLEDLRRVPTMTKQDARVNRERIRWANVPGGAFRYTTGGSSGEPLIFYFGRSRQASDHAGRMRARRWWGVEPCEREVYLWGAPVELNKADRLRTLRDRLLNQVLLNAFEMSPSRMDDYLETLERFQPKCIYGYASSVALLASHAAQRGVKPRLPQLRVICTTGEPLYPHQREIIERTFGARVANEFGSRDLGFTAHETPHGQMLLISESDILEVLDDQGNPVAPGEMGEAVITGLYTDAQPFIRYRTGDMVRMAQEPCRDGRGLHVIREVIGRTTDFIVRADGTIMHALSVIYVLRTVAGIAQFKVIQHTKNDFEILIVPDTRWSDAANAEVRAGLHARLGDEARLNIRLLDDIPPATSGKHRYVVSHVRTGLPT